MYELVQMLGRVNRKGTAEPGSNTYEVHVDATSYASLFVRIMRIPDADERRVQLRALHDVLGFLVTPSECYHLCIEKYFECVPLPKTACGTRCSFCCGDTSDFTKRINKDGVISFLSTNISSNDNFKFSSFTKSMKAYKDQLFHPQDVPKGSMAQFHALTLQLIATGIIGLKVKDNKHIGTDKIQMTNVTVFLSFGQKKLSHNLVVNQPAFLMNNNWSNLNLYHSDNADGDGETLI